jgi:hypothetical protein
MNDEPTNDQLEDLLERFAAEQGGELDEERFLSIAEEILATAKSHSALGAQVRELIDNSASLFLSTVDEAGDIELRLGFPDDPERWSKAHGQSVPLGKFPFSRIASRPQG